MMVRARMSPVWTVPCLQHKMVKRDPMGGASDIEIQDVQINMVENIRESIDKRVLGDAGVALTKVDLEYGRVRGAVEI